MVGSGWWGGILHTGPARLLHENDHEMGRKETGICQGFGPERLAEPPFLFLNLQCSAPWRVGKGGPPGKWSVSTTVTTWSIKSSVTRIISQKPTRTVPCHHALSGPQMVASLSTLSKTRIIAPGASALAAPTCWEETSGGPAPGEQWVFPEAFANLLSSLSFDVVLGGKQN